MREDSPPPHWGWLGILRFMWEDEGGQKKMVSVLKKSSMPKKCNLANKLTNIVLCAPQVIFLFIFCAEKHYLRPIFTKNLNNFALVGGLGFGGGPQIWWGDTNGGDNFFVCGGESEFFVRWEGIHPHYGPKRKPCGG